MQLLKIVFFFILLSSVLYAQEDSLSVKYDDSKLVKQNISEDNLNEYKQDDAFNYDEVEQEESLLSRFKRWLGNLLTRFFEAIFGVGNASGILYFIFNILPYLILAILLFLLIKFFLKVNSKNIISGKQNPATVSFSDDERIIKTEDISALIIKAIKDKDYRLAIRYYYLQSLKQLSDKQLITWHLQKTNEDYISEIKIDNLKSNFKTITKIYDYVWYGEFPISELKFENLKIPFEDLKTAIKN